MLSGVGLRSSDYAFVQTGSGAAGLNAVSPSASTVWPFRTSSSRSTKSSVTRRPLLPPPDPQGHRQRGLRGGPATIQAKADAMRRFCRAIVKASLFVRVNPAAAARLYLQGSASASPPMRSRRRRSSTGCCKTIPGRRRVDPRIGYLSPQALQLYSTYLTQYGMTHASCRDDPGDRSIHPFANDFDHQALENYARSFPT